MIISDISFLRNFFKYFLRIHWTNLILMIYVFMVSTLMYDKNMLNFELYFHIAYSY